MLRNADTGQEASALSSSTGFFSLSGLPPGSYVVRVGTATSNHAIVVEAARTTRLRLRTVGTMVAVSADGDGAAPPLESGDDNDGLPTSRGLQSLQSGNVIDGTGAEQIFNSVPAGAGSGQDIDPADDSDLAESSSGPDHGLGRGRHAGISYLYAEGSVREFRVATNTYSAQVGSTGDVLAAVTRQGNEHFHGSAFLRVRSNVLAARDPLAIATSFVDGSISSKVVKPHDLRENFGLTLGGPFPALQKLRYFAAVESQHRGFPAVSSPSNPHFYELTNVQKALLGTRGVGSATTSSALSYISSLTGITDRRADEGVEFGRLEWLMHPRFAVGLQGNRARWTSPAGLLESPVVATGRASLGNSSGSVDQLLARAEIRGPAGVSHQVAISFMRDLQYETPQTPLPQEPAIGPAGSAPEVNIGPDGLLFGTPANLSQVAYPDEKRVELRETGSANWGRHLFQFGGSYGRVSERVATLPNAAGTFRYDSGATRGRAGGLVDFISDYTFNVNSYPNGACPSIVAVDHLFCFRSFSQSFGQTRVGFPMGTWTAFVEDIWRPIARMTLHAGVRYEYTALPQPSRSNPAVDAIFGNRGLTGNFPQDRNNLGPRLAAAFEPFGRGRGMLKIGYGVFFGRMPGATVASALTQTGLPAATTRVRIRPSAVTACPQAPANGFGYPCSFVSLPDDVVASTRAVVVLDHRFRLPVVQQGNVTLERELGNRTTVAVEAVINEDRQLPSSTDMNIMPSNGVGRFQLQGGTGTRGVRDGESFVVPIYTERVTPNFGPVTDVVSNVNATYDGLIVRIASRPIRNLQINCRYTWSKAIDFGQAGSATPRTDGQFDPFADGYDKGLSSLNFPHAFHLTAAWTPRPEKGQRLRALANGWTASTSSTARSGRPYSLDISGGSYLKGGHESVNGSGGALYLPTVGRNTLKLPALIKTDLRVTRSFPLRRGVQGNASADAFNVFNHQSVSSVNQRAFLVGQDVEGVTPLVFQDAAHISLEGLNTTPFGTRTGNGSSLSRERQIELSFRVSF